METAGCLEERNYVTKLNTKKKNVVLKKVGHNKHPPFVDKDLKHEKP